MAKMDRTAHDQFVLCHRSHEPFQPQRCASFSANKENNISATFQRATDSVLSP